MVFRFSTGVLLLMTMLAACANTGTMPNGDSGTTLPSEPPTIVGEITDLGARMLVEQQPEAAIGNKIFFSLMDATDVFQRAGDGLQSKTIDDLAVGQSVEVWADGAVAASYPGQAGAAVIVIADTAADITPEPDTPALPNRAPDAVGTITQASNTVWIDQELVLFITPTTQFLRRSDEELDVMDARDISEGQRVEVWVDEIRYAPQPQANAVAILVTD
jgi:hypothetical protein